jgi:hypothetical protein
MTFLKIKNTVPLKPGVDARKIFFVGIQPKMLKKNPK